MTLPSLPDLMVMPMHLRCDFCIKFDSVCSVCHFKWKGLLAAKRKGVFAQLDKQMEYRRVAIFFGSLAKGDVEFVSAMIEQYAQSREWFVQFTNFGTGVMDRGGGRSSQTASPAPGGATTAAAATAAVTGVHPLYLECGRVFPLHVAAAYNRLDMASMLLDKGAPFRRSESRHTPIDLLTRPPEQPEVSSEWEAMLATKPAYAQFRTVERARALRNAGQFDEALAEYNAALDLNPRLEAALCGLAKLHYDRRAYALCIEQCDSILLVPARVDWLEFTPDTVLQLRRLADAGFHAECHASRGSALKACGCVVVHDDFRVRIRRLPFALLRECVMPFCTAVDMYAWFRASPMPLLRGALTTATSVSCDDTVGNVLAGEFGYTEMYESIRAEAPKPDNRTFGDVTRFLGVQVVAMGDFHTFILRVLIEARNPLHKKKRGWFGSIDEASKNTPEFVKVNKLFRVSRSGVGKAWDVHEAGEWELFEAPDAPGGVSGTS